MLVAMAVWFFRKRRVVKIYLDNRESFSKDNIYYSSVNKKIFFAEFAKKLLILHQSLVSYWKWGFFVFWGKGRGIGGFRRVISGMAHHTF